MTNNIAALPPLVAHSKTLDRLPNRMGWLTPSDAKAPTHELQAQYREQGYLWLKHILSRDRVFEFRGQYFAAFENFGLLQADTPLTLGIAAEVVPLSAEIRHMESLLARWTAYEAFCLMPEIITFYEAFLGGRTYLHKRKLIRRTAPGSECSTPAHYDLVYLRGGTDKSLCTFHILPQFGDEF